MIFIRYIWGDFMWTLPEKTHDYMKRRINLLKESSCPDISKSLISNGVYMPLLGVCLYFGINVKDTEELLKTSLVLPHVKIQNKPFYFRPDLWTIWDAYLRCLQRNYPEHLRLQQEVVSAADVAVFYELSVTSASKILHKNRVPIFKYPHATKLLFYSLPIVQEKERMKAVFSSRAFTSGNNVKYNIATGIGVFRDIECPRYDDCSAFACVTSDYMNCALCPRCSLHKNSLKSEYKRPPLKDPLAVFAPANSVAALRDVEAYINTKLCGNLALLPNVFD